MKFFSRLVSRQFILRLVAFGVFANGLLIVITTLLGQVLESNRHLSSLFSSLPLILGLTLIYLATLLKRRKLTAWLVVLPVYGFVFGLNISEVFLFASHRHLGFTLLIRGLLVPAIVVYGLLVYKGEFTVKSDIQSFTLAARTTILVLLIAFAYGIGGFMLLDTRDFRQEISVTAAAHRTVDQFDLTSDKELVPYTRRAQLFTDSLSIISVGAVLYAFMSLFQPLRSRLSDQSRNREQMLGLLKSHVVDSEDYFKLWPHDKIYFFNWQHSAALAYHVYHGVALVVGDPAGARKDFSDLIDEFTEFCRLNDWLPAFIHTGSEYKDLYIKHNFSLQKIGEEALLNIHNFTAETIGTKYFRQLHSKLHKQDYKTELLSPPHNQAIINRLRSVSDEWLKLPGRTERGFMMGYFSDEYMQQCHVMVLRDAAGTIQAFINQIPAFDQNEANYDLLRHTRQAPTNSNDFLLMDFISYLDQQGFTSLNLGLCPLAGLDNADHERSAIDGTLNFVYTNGDRFYSFSGLYRFKAKYQPTWRSRYIVYKGGIRGFTRTLNALNRLMRKTK